MLLYILTILISMAIIATTNCFFVAPLHGFYVWEIVLWTCISTLSAIIIDGIFSTLVRRALPEKWFNGLYDVYRAGKRESRFYEKLGIKKWKDKIIDLGCFTNFRKNKIYEPTNNQYVLRYVTEANFGVVCHICCMLFGMGAIFCCPIKLWFTIGIYVSIVNLVLNALPLFTLRYNLTKLHKLYHINELRNKKVR